MAGTAVTFSGDTSIQCKYTDSDNDWGGLVLNVTAVRYVAETTKLEIDWSTQFISKSTGRPYIGGLRAAINGTELFFNTGSPLYNYTYTPYKNQETYLTGTLTIDAVPGTTQSVAVLVEGLFGRYYSASAWSSYKVSGSGTVSVVVPAAGYVKVNGAWVNATPYVKVNGSWVKATPYVKVNGAWTVTK